MLLGLNALGLSVKFLQGLNIILQEHFLCGHSSPENPGNTEVCSLAQLGACGYIVFSLLHFSWRMLCFVN